MFSATPPSGGGAPSASFDAAANQAGFWNGVDALGPVNPTALRNLNGQLTSVTMLASGGIGVSGGVNFSGNTGDIALLLNDFAFISGANIYTFAGLIPGDYIVYSYAVEPSSSNVRLTNVDVGGSVEGIQTVTGPMPGNSFVQGITHSIHHVHATSGTLVVTLSSQDINAKVNGFQIVAVPEPGTLVACSCGFLSLVRSKKKKRRQISWLR